jgi:hypothetical protein
MRTSSTGYIEWITYLYTDNLYNDYVKGVACNNTNWVYVLLRNNKTNYNTLTMIKLTYGEGKLIFAKQPKFRVNGSYKIYINLQGYQDDFKQDPFDNTLFTASFIIKDNSYFYNYYVNMKDNGTHIISPF